MKANMGILPAIRSLYRVENANVPDGMRNGHLADLDAFLQLT